jgi:hypothetical protein
MAIIKTINSLDENKRGELYSLLIPDPLFKMFAIDPHTFNNAQGIRSVFFTSSKGGYDASIMVKRNPEDRDPVFLIEIEDSKDTIQLLWCYININNPDAQRFHTDIDANGRDRWLNWTSRNVVQEVEAMRAGLAPGQVCSGLRLMWEVNKSLDRFCQVVNFKSILLEALFYHNAVIFERHGFRYLEGEKRMKRIHEAFQPGGKLNEKLDGSTSFRQPDAWTTIRGRSWAIHDGILDEVEDEILDEPWYSPKMYRMVGKYYNINTFPGGIY